MRTFKEGRGGRPKAATTQFSIRDAHLEVFDWQGNLLVIDFMPKGMQARIYELSEKGGPLQGVEPHDAGTGNRPRQVTVQEYIEERQRDEQALQDAQETLPSSEAQSQGRLKWQDSAAGVVEDNGFQSNRRSSSVPKPRSRRPSSKVKSTVPGKTGKSPRRQASQSHSTEPSKTTKPGAKRK